jgi:hypothetical protein
MVRAPVEVDQDHIPLGVVDSHNLLEDKVDKGVVVTWDVGAIHGNERVLVASRVRLVTYLGRNGQVVVVKGIHCSYFAVREGLLEADFACLVYQIRVTLHTWASYKPGRMRITNTKIKNDGFKRPKDKKENNQYWGSKKTALCKSLLFRVSRQRICPEVVVIQSFRGSYPFSWITRQKLVQKVASLLS